MRIFNQDKTEELFEYDESKGYLKQDKLFKEHRKAVPEVPAQTADEVASALIEAGFNVDNINGEWYKVEKTYPNGGKSVIKILPVEYQPAVDEWDEYEPILVYIPYTDEQLKEIEARKYIPTAISSAIALLRTLPIDTTSMTATTKLEASGVFLKWKPGKYVKGDIRNYYAQTYECTTDHDNAIYPDITPENPQTWANFWKPLHGTTEATARPWTQPLYGTTDMYLTGEYMVYTDGQMYKCLSNTSYSPEEYAQAWQIVNKEN